MKVFKFGGASVNSAEAVKNVASILRRYPDEKLVVVFSAMGKTTNALEEVVSAAWHGHPDTEEKIAVVADFHQQILDGLFDDRNNPAFNLLDGLIGNIRDYLQNTAFDYDEFYDRIVPYGELISTAIISAYFDETGLQNILVPAPTLLKTDSRFRDAGVDWEKTGTLIRVNIPKIFEENPGHLIITQGFIGSARDGRRTTLGREGSDFTASVFAYCLDAESVVVWKDVEGLLNADPVYFRNTSKIERISYRETIELAFYGAKILHPKTIKPLQNKNIPLEIKSFFNPDATGSVIHASEKSDRLLPFLILKQDQVLVSFSTRDFSFITEAELHRLFKAFDELNIHINLMQNSAISFTICINNPAHKLNELIWTMRDRFEIRYNSDLELITIRHFNEGIIKEHLTGCDILLEQRSRSTLQVVYRK